MEEIKGPQKKRNDEIKYYSKCTLISNIFSIITTEHNVVLLLQNVWYLHYFDMKYFCDAD